MADNKVVAFEERKKKDNVNFTGVIDETSTLTQEDLAGFYQSLWMWINSEDYIRRRL